MIQMCKCRLAAPYVVDWDEDGVAELLIGDYDGRVRCPDCIWLILCEVVPNSYVSEVLFQAL